MTVISQETEAAVGDFGPVLSRLRAEADRYFGTPNVSLSPLRLVERPVSHVLQVRVQAERAEYSAFLKRFKPKGEGDEHWRFMRDRVERDFCASLRAHKAFANSTDFSAVRPIACFPDELILITEEVPGQTLGSILERRAVWHPTKATLGQLVDIHERIGTWIRTFQAIEPLGRRFSLDEMREYLDLRLKKIVGSDREEFSEADRTTVLRYFDRRRRNVSIEDLTEVIVHADVCPANILVQGRKIALIDFAMSGTGGLYHDLARMFTQLHFMTAKPKFRPWVIARLQSAILRGFDPALTPDRPLFELFLLQHTLTQFTKLSVRPAQSMERYWNWHLRRRHRRWLRALSAA